MSQLPPVAAALEELRLAEARLERRRDAASEPSATERALLRRVFEASDRAECVSPSELAEHVGLSRPATSAMLGRLQREGIVALHPHPEDGRRRCIRPLSRNDHLGGDDDLTDRMRDAASRLDDREAEVVLAFLEDLRRMVDATGPELAERSGARS